MFDPNWIVEGAKYVGGAIFGATGSSLAARNKKRRMRRHLYKEIANNYGLLREGLRRAHEPAGILPRDILPEPLHTEYYEHSKKSELELYSELHESYAFDTIYQQLTRCAGSRGAQLITNVIDLTNGIERMLANGALNLRLFKKMAEPWVAKLIEDSLNR